MHLHYTCTLLAVKDVAVSKQFYHDLFDQEVAMDLGLNVTFSGGFAIQQRFGWLLDFPESEIVSKPKNMELYFEADDFDAFLERLRTHPEVQLVHPPKTHEWKQRVVRIFDPDGHIIEIGESMAVIARRYLAQGLSAEETAKTIQHPIEFVRAVQAGKV